MSIVRKIRATRRRRSTRGDLARAVAAAPTRASREEIFNLTSMR
jgi:hypothetical protein